MNWEKGGLGCVIGWGSCDRFICARDCSEVSGNGVGSVSESFGCG